MPEHEYEDDDYCYDFGDYDEEEENRSLPSDLFDGGYGSFLWRAERGRPPFVYLPGLWMFHIHIALFFGFGAGMLIFLTISSVLFAIGNLVDLGEEGYELFGILAGAIAVPIGLYVVYRCLAPAARCTRLYRILGEHSEEEFEEALAEYEAKKKQER